MVTSVLREKHVCGRINRTRVKKNNENILLLYFEKHYFLCLQNGIKAGGRLCVLCTLGSVCGDAANSALPRALRMDPLQAG